MGYEKIPNLMKNTTKTSTGYIYIYSLNNLGEGENNNKYLNQIIK
jgi:hypothetical protein